MTRSRLTCIWLVTNVCIVPVYLYLASWTWSSPNLPELSWAERHGPADDIIWGVTALPILLGAILLNLAVAGCAVWSRWCSGMWRVTLWAWCIPALWLFALEIDRYHQ